VAKRDYYEVLGVARDAGDAEIKKSFRQLARRYHPDVNKDDADAAERFREAAEAYEVLATPETRARYDRFGHAGVDQSQIHTEQFMDFGSLSDLLGAFFGDDLFGGAMGGRRAARGADAGTSVTLTFAEAAFGVTREVESDIVSTCERCGGDGAEPGTSPTRCLACQGAGRVSQLQSTIFGRFVQTAICPTCRGRGEVVESPCRECRGRGRRALRRTVEVTVPAGIADGQRLRIPGRGHEGEPGAPAGDLYVDVAVTPDPRFRRDGNDVVVALDVTMTQAALGATVTVPTLEEDEQVRIESGAQPGDTIVLGGRGIPQLGRRGRGDLRVVVNVVVPRRLSDEQRRLLERFEESADDATYGEDASFISRLKSAFR
jgi:molecular chaperone DnaJ